MSRKHVVIIIVVAAIAAAIVGVNAWLSSYYEGVDAKDVPLIAVEAAEQRVFPVSAEVTIPLFGGAQEKFPKVADALEPLLGSKLEKSLYCVPGENGEWLSTSERAEYVVPGGGLEIGLIGDAPYEFEFKLPAQMFWSVKLCNISESGSETTIYISGEAKHESSQGFSDSVIIKKAGEYVFYAEGTLSKTGRDMPSGVFYYRAAFSVKNPDPVFVVGRNELEQGDILSLRLENLPEGVVPELDSMLGPAIFSKEQPHEGQAADESSGLTAEGFCNWYAAVPVSNSRAVGEYPVTVRAGELVYETTVTVLKYDFDFQNMIIDTSVPSVASAVTGQAIAEFREKMIPLFSVFSDERYWDGYFEMPIKMGPADFISTQFGEIRITNGDQSTRRSHLGMDIAASTGVPVYASGAGRVLLAEFLLNTGYTVVIDHGGGLISIYYHMSAVDTVEGVFVEQGELIGRVGSTGYSTGPHLHFEMRIGDQPISPSMLFDPEAGLYSAR